MIRVVGLGNVLMGDDGFGPSVVHALECGWDFPPSVEVVDAGTPGLSLTPFFSGVDVLVVVDVAHHGGPPGEVREFTLEEVLRIDPGPRVSPHDVGLQAALHMVALAGIGPEAFHLVAAAPESVATGPGLTPRLRGAVGETAGRVVELLARHGAHAVRRERPVEAVAWWDVKACEPRA